MMQDPTQLKHTYTQTSADWQHARISHRWVQTSKWATTGWLRHLAFVWRYSQGAHTCTHKNIPQQMELKMGRGLKVFGHESEEALQVRLRHFAHHQLDVKRGHRAEHLAHQRLFVQPHAHLQKKVCLNACAKKYVFVCVCCLRGGWNGVFYFKRVSVCTYVCMIIILVSPLLITPLARSVCMCANKGVDDVCAYSFCPG